MENSFWCDKYYYTFPIHALELKCTCGNKQQNYVNNGYRAYVSSLSYNTLMQLGRTLGLEIIKSNNIIYVKNKKD